MAAMVVTAATGALSSLLSKLSDLLTDQYKQRKGVRRDIEFLRCELTDMNAALETLADMEKLDAQTKVWRDNVARWPMILRIPLMSSCSSLAKKTTTTTMACFAGL